jgi:tRNA (guanine37-N1)-methyltransferase
VVFEVFSLLPEVFPAYLETSILRRARENGSITVHIHSIRDFAHDRHRTTDDVPYGGGGGMVMKPEPVFEAVETVLGAGAEAPQSCPIILLTPQGRKFDQDLARSLARETSIALICGRYEGVDERIRTNLATDEISIGDYVLTGGELPALVLIDAVARHLPGVLGDPDAAQFDSHSNSLLEHPQFTRPPDFRGERVPEILLSGDHARIAKWRRHQSLLRTRDRRPDLLDKAELSDEDLEFLADHSSTERT